MELETEKQDNLTEREIKILMSLEENPLATFEELSEISGYAKSVVFNTYQTLSNQENDNYIFRVVATPNLNAIGMEIIDVLVEIGKPSQSAFIEELCYEHPYTLYSARMHGRIDGHYIQFRVPVGTKDNIVELFDILKQKGDIENFSLKSFFLKTTFTKTQVKCWNHNALKWSFDWKEWFDKLVIEKPILDNNNLENKLTLEDKSVPTDVQNFPCLPWLKKKDLYIIIELMRDTRRKHTDLIEFIEKNYKFSFNVKTFSRRIKRIIDECISGYRVFLNPRVFDIHNPILIIGTGKEEYILSLARNLQKNPIPFTSTFRHNQDTFFWYVHLPSSHLSDLIFYLNPIIYPLHVSFIDHPRSRQFNINVAAYDEIEKKWNTNHDFMVQNVIEYMDKWKKDNLDLKL